MEMNRVALIPLVQAKPGMTLEKDVRNSLGQVLLKACELSAHRSHFTFGVIVPLNCRRNGATLFPA
jgi:hypothetical protein